MASRSWNRVELIGNLTRDPELRFTPNGAAVCTFGIATNRTYVSEGEKKEEVDFHRIVAWNKLAELCNQLLKKGVKVFISGRLQTRSWEGQDGQQRQTTEIVVEDMILLTPKAAGEYTQAEEVPVPEEVKESRPKDDQPLAEKESKELQEVKEKDEKTSDSVRTAEKKEKAPKVESSEEIPPQEEVKDDLPF